MTEIAPKWLEDIDGEQALSWVRAHSSQARQRLTGTHFDQLKSQIQQVLDSPDRIPFVTKRGDFAYSFWTDADHPRGVWRRMLFKDYVAETVHAANTLDAGNTPGEAAELEVSGGPEWDILIDVDALAQSENASWVWHGAQLLRPHFDRALITLSDGGTDEDVTREFDLTTRTFVPDGFNRPASKGWMSWLDRDSVWLCADFGPGTVSTSGYPLQARLLRRGQALENALPVLSGSPDDLLTEVSHDFTPGWECSFGQVAQDFYHSTYFVIPGTGPGSPALRTAVEGSNDATEAANADVPVELKPLALPLPADAELGLWHEWALITTRSDWPQMGLGTGVLVAITREDLFHAAEHRQKPTRDQLHVLFEPDEHTVFQAMTATSGNLLITVTTDVVTHLLIAVPENHSWAVTALDVTDTDIPPFATISAVALEPADSRVWLTVSGFATPTSLYLADTSVETDAAADNLAQTSHLKDVKLVRQAPELFDAGSVEVSQHFATSADGTRVPYFQVGSGSPAKPTLLNGYGGFQFSLVPSYSGVIGRALLERGGTFVVANIRGGGEYGPAWHQAALKENRPRAYEDFEAVARDLISRGVTTPSRLAIEGRSNGGLLTGNMLMRTPELFGAVVIGNPLLDMRKFHTLLAGASWMPEYGNPDDPDQWAFIKHFSPVHMFDAQRSYPPTLITTSTRDDRVHPWHARALAWEMLEAGCDVTFFENTEGGHAGAADNSQRAMMQALTWEFIWHSVGQ